MCIIKKLICYLILVGCISDCFSQDDEFLSITKKFDQFRDSSLPEKMFVHTDKEFYLAGEIAWFKIYAVDGFFHQPLSLSKVAYVELLDANNNPLLQAKINMENGHGDGSFFIPVNMHSGNYKLRAYSNWMKNFGPLWFFEKKLAIINTQQPAEAVPAKQPAPVVEIHFFPEGGNLVNGLQSKVGFSITDQAGKGIVCSGIILDNKKETVTRFNTLKFGLGNFSITPVLGQVYTALITLPNGKLVSQQLPASFTDGYVMNLDALSDPNKIRVTVTATGAAAQRTSLYLFVHTRGILKAAMSGMLQNGATIFLIDKGKPGEGISQFTVFNEDKKPVCERLYFKYSSQKMIVDIKPDAATYNLRQKINLSIGATGQNGLPEVADMSMAVYRIDSLQALPETGINEYLWLNADLAGNIESPSYYFSSQDAATEQAMDNLMLVNGWRRFRWEDILQNDKKFFQYIPEYNGHLIYGKVINSRTGAPAPNIYSYLSAPGINTVFRTSVSDSAGRVKFELKNFYASQSIIVQTNVVNGVPYRVEIDNPFSAQYSAKPLGIFTMPAKNPLTLLDHSIGVQVENIYNGDHHKQLTYRLIDTNAFYYQPNERYLLDNYTRFTTMEEVLREYVVAVNVRKRKGKFFLPVYNDADRLVPMFENDPLVLLDGVPVVDMDKLMRYDPLKVRKMEVVTRRYVYGNMAFDGIVNLVTYNGDLEDYELDPNATVIDYEALQLEREFYSPAYETAQQVGNHTPDFRNVLNWSPMIRTNLQGNYQTSFYSSDLPGKYAVVVQGLTQSGKAASGVTYFEVKKPAK